MAQTKKSNKKRVKILAPAAATTAAKIIPNNEDESKDLSILNDKKTIDIESALEPAVILEEKEIEDVPVVTEDADEAGDELSLDDEELNPFGDKWEQ